ncbi:MAG: L,D-transpeptidase [Polyangiaceae bacterium]
MPSGRLARLPFWPFAVTTACAVVAGCTAAEDPPGRTVGTAGAAVLDRPSATVAAAAGSPPLDDAHDPGHGHQLASIAMRTWIYVAPDDRSTKLGYLRAGAVIERGAEPVGNKRCAGGWYRVVPRGYVCVGKGASLSLDHQVVQAALRGPDRSGGPPYRYVMSRERPPHLYFRLPSREDQERTEGSTLGTHLAMLGGLDDVLGPFDPVPEFLAQGRDLPKPYGAEEKLHYSVHTGKARESSAFGLVAAFEWTGRHFGLTTELDLIPLDRTKPARPSSFKGIVVETEGMPAFVVRGGAIKYRTDSLGTPREDGQAPGRSGWVLTGREVRGLAETSDGTWLATESLIIPEKREDPAGFARAGKKWIDISIKRQTLIAYEGTRPVYATLVSTGLAGMGDPETTPSTIRGTFMIHAKHVSATMDGELAEGDFDLRDVPFIQYFTGNYALHGAYWHDEFGKARSHGCINLAPADAAWLFEWTDPVVPKEWHGAVNLEAGTLVYTHP